jgi:ketosteroid isomerase-like protein
VPFYSAAAELNNQVRAFWNAWNSRNTATVAQFYLQTPSLVVYLPWRTEGFTGWEAFRQAAGNVLQTMQTLKFTPYDDMQILQFGDVAVTAGPFKVLMRDRNGTTTQDDARYTLVWQKQDGKWRSMNIFLLLLAKGTIMVTSDLTCSSSKVALNQTKQLINRNTK